MKSDSESITVDYGFDKNKLGVRTSYKTDDATPEIWKIPNGQLDPLARMQQEVLDDKTIDANGKKKGVKRKAPIKADEE